MLVKHTVLPVIGRSAGVVIAGITYVKIIMSAPVHKGRIKNLKFL
jgi:hypothetical protein